MCSSVVPSGLNTQPPPSYYASYPHTRRVDILNRNMVEASLVKRVFKRVKTALRLVRVGSFCLHPRILNDSPTRRRSLTSKIPYRRPHSHWQLPTGETLTPRSLFQPSCPPPLLLRDCQVPLSGPHRRILQSNPNRSRA